eukprot:Hpha_TRINITY_DN23894_c0_g1::TRINITY_DN23894_c0_g1_i1::g.109912::m.109912/K07783/uhpC; MFS transporter, OPA family, sugar phosphate sensor protein UhpC
MSDQQRLRRWQQGIFVVLVVGYFAYTAARRGVATVQKDLEENSGFERKDIGTLHSTFNIAYGVSKFAGNLLTDYFPAGILYGAGLGLAALANITMAYSSSVLLSSIVWGLNGLVQGVGWPALSVVVMAWYPKDRRGGVWALCTVGGNVAKALCPVVLALAVRYGGWRAALLTPAGLALFMSLASFALLKGSPREVGLQLEADDAPGQVAKRVEARGGYRFLWDLDFWIINLGNAASYFVLQGVSDWAQRLLEERHGFPPVEAAGAVFWGECGGIAATLGSGFLSDRLGGNRNLTSLLFAALVPLGTGALLLRPGGGLLWCCFALFVASAGANGPKTMSGLEVRERNGSSAGKA